MYVLLFVHALVIERLSSLVEKEMKRVLCRHGGSGRVVARRPERAGCGLRVAAASAQKMIYIVCVAAERGRGGRFLKQIQSTADMGEYYY